MNFKFAVLDTFIKRKYLNNVVKYHIIIHSILSHYEIRLVSYQKSYIPVIFHFFFGKAVCAKLTHTLGGDKGLYLFLKKLLKPCKKFVKVVVFTNLKFRVYIWFLLAEKAGRWAPSLGTRISDWMVTWPAEEFLPHPPEVQFLMASNFDKNEWNWKILSYSWSETHILWFLSKKWHHKLYIYENIGISNL